jgi:thioredoxin reductase (NADPH)
VADNDYDIVIAGAGIAGLTAALVAARAGRRTRVFTGPALGGQLLSIERIDGYPGFPDGIAGYDLCPMAQEQAVAAGAEFSAAEVTGLDADGGRWRVTSGEGDMRAGVVIIATGTSSRELGIPGEAQLRGKGVSHCASCDGPLLRSRTVGVVGGGDSAFQEALTLAQFASRVIVLHRGETFRAQAAYRDLAHASDRIEIRTNTIVEEVLGDGAVAGVRTRTTDGAETNAELAALFVYIGLTPNTAWLNGALDLSPSGHIPTDDQMRSRLPGLFAVGTVRSGSAGRAVSAGGDGAMAAVAADRYLTDGAWRV